MAEMIADTADVLDVEGRAWLLVPASPWLLDTLAAFGAEAEDREPCLEDEPGVDREPEEALEDDCPEVRVRFADARRKPRRSGDLTVHGPDGALWRHFSLT